ncbi:MAG: hypothetical protein LWX51_09290 [Deltaproteobacteria bacterium]|nr:hypothetical protein [Deltaproteobacteria bacterium]
MLDTSVLIAGIVEAHPVHKRALPWLQHIKSGADRGTCGATYDALILFVALKAEVDRVLTLNEKDFRRLYPSFAGNILSP